MHEFFKDMPKYWPVGVAVPVGICLFLSDFTGTHWPRLILWAAMVAIAAFTTMLILARHSAALKARLSDDAPFAWEVWMNGVQIGLITDGQYASIQRAAFGSGRLIVGQLFNLVHVALTIARRVFVAVPLLMFWLLVMASVVTPETVIEVGQALSITDPAELANGLRPLYRWGFMMILISVSIMLGLGYRFGFRNHYDEAVGHMIRKHCNTPAEGNIKLSKVYLTQAAGYGYSF